MSASTSVARRAVVLNPFRGNGRIVPRSALHASSLHLARNSRTLAARNPALAILIPMRSLSTGPEKIPVGGPPGGPPPGFDAEKAKNPPKTSRPSPTDAAPTKAAEQLEDLKKVAQDAAENPISLSELAVEKEGALAKSDKKDEKKLSLAQKIKRELRHYWDGTKLLATEVRISSRLALKMAAGYELTRRESRQLQRTVQDLGRLVPFSVFVIVPFAELLLPVALKLFPNLLPSTYEGQKDKDKKAAFLRATRNEVSSFLRQTLKETGLPLTVATAQKEEFARFFRKVRATGEKPTAEDVIKVCKIFRDDLTLDNLSRPQLVSMCRYMNLNTFGTDMMLRYTVRHRMRQIKRDDRAISYEGVGSLTVGELQMACASRGIKSHTTSPARMREDLQTWLDLRLKEGVPSTLLVLSNAFMYGEANTGDDAVKSSIEALTGVLSSLPEELFHEIELEVHNAEGAATNKQRLEVLKEQQSMIEDEAEQNESHETTGFATPRDVDNIDDTEAKHQVEAGKDTKEEVKEAQATEAAEAEQESIEAAKEDAAAKPQADDKSAAAKGNGDK